MKKKTKRFLLTVRDILIKKRQLFDDKVAANSLRRDVYRRIVSDKATVNILQRNHERQMRVSQITEQSRRESYGLFGVNSFLRLNRFSPRKDARAEVPCREQSKFRN